MRAWWYGGRNWGDILTPILVARLTGALPTRALGPGTTLAIGSIMHRLRARDVVWGTGCIGSTHFPRPLPEGVTFRAVRGPATRRVLCDAGAAVPKVYGDPALLVPWLYRPEVAMQRRLGVIPHYVDRAALAHLAADPEVLLIDIESGVEEVIRAVGSCEAIASSSLHGVVLGDAYGKPTAWLRTDGCSRLVGGDWKFRDYFAGTGRPDAPATDVKSGEARPALRWLPRPEVDLDQLLAACPFNPLGLRLAHLTPEVLR